jgi:hypothetical protein
MNKPRDDTLPAYLAFYGSKPELRLDPRYNLFLSEPDVEAFSGLSGSTRQELIAKDPPEFPASVPVARRRKATDWLELLIWKIWVMRDRCGFDNFMDAIRAQHKQAIGVSDEK